MARFLDDTRHSYTVALQRDDPFAGEVDETISVVHINDCQN